MKKIIISIVLLSFLQPGFPQTKLIDSLKNQLLIVKDDTSKVLALGALADYYGFIQFDSSVFYGRQSLDLSNRINYQYGKLLGFRSMYFALNCQGNYPKALEAVLNMLKISKQIAKERPSSLDGSHYFLGVLNREMDNDSNAIAELREAIEIH